MSEYQYYEFLAIDRPLSTRAMAELRRLSSRATITPTRFVNVYNWGDFRGSPAKLVEKHFDAFLYDSNFGDSELMLKVPASSIDRELGAPYLGGREPVLRRKGKVIIFSACRSSEDGGDGYDDEEGGEGRLATLVAIRSELMRGDLRAAYLAWLLNVQQDLVNEDEIEPPCPAGLAQLSPAQQALTEFLGIDPDLVAAAAERSPRLRQVSSREIRSAIAALPVRRKDAILVSLANEEPTIAYTALLRELPRASVPPSTAERRTAGELMAAVS